MAILLGLTSFMMSNFVVAGGIVRNRAWCLPQHLDAVISNLDLGDDVLYLTGDNVDGTESVLSEYMVEYLVHDTGHPGYKRDPGPHRYDAANMAFLRNLWAEEAIKRWPHLTHLWVVDSDVIPEPDCLIKLLALDKSVVAAHVPLMDGVTPIWMEDWNPRFIETRDASGVLRPGSDLPRRSGVERYRLAPQPCALVGGCYLIRRDAWDKGLRWSPTEISEDGGFARSARDLGIEMWAHPGARTQHLMKEPS